MKPLSFIIPFLAGALFSLSLPAQDSSEELAPTSPSFHTISFGSCNNQLKPQYMWQFVVQNHPDLWIWLGDNIYADTDDMQLLAQKFQFQKQNPEYQKLLHQCPVIGTWDDHDYGLNDGGKEFYMKKESQQQLLDFLDLPQDAPVRSREGVYDAYYLGEAPNRVKIIILDTRYFRDSLITEKVDEWGGSLKKRCLPNADGDVLGEQQWQWLESELRNDDAAITLICSSIQVIANEHPFEKWANFPQARQRFFDLLIATQTPNVIILSGDRHIGEISRFDLEGLNYPLYEVTSSGLTHTWAVEREEDNQFRVGDLIIKKNFGILKIDWQESGPKVSAEIHGLGNQVFLSEHLNWE